MKITKKLAVLAVTGVMLALSMAQLTFADTYSSTGNGAVVRYNDGSKVEYNARGSSITWYDSRGNVIDEEYAQLTETEFKALYYSSSKSSSGKKSSSTNKYAGSTVNDAYHIFCGA